MPGDPTPAEGGDHCATRAAAYCAKAEECEVPFLDLLYGDRPSCIEYETDRCAFLTALPDGARTRQHNWACAQAIGKATCASWGGGDAPVFECLPPPGQRKIGAVCLGNEQCRSGSCVRLDFFDACGVCGVEQPTTAAGGACTHSTATCATGYACRSERCEPVTEGTPCREHEDCGGRLECAGDRCVRLPGDGQACLGTRPASSCELGYACLPDNICRREPLPGEGQACGALGALGSDACRGGHLCRDGKCAALPRPGQPCRDICHGLFHVGCVKGTCERLTGARCPASMAPSCQNCGSNGDCGNQLVCRRAGPGAQGRCVPPYGATTCLTANGDREVILGE